MRCLYEIPITLARTPPRKHMRRVAPHGHRYRQARVAAPIPLDQPQSAFPAMRNSHATKHAKEHSCWTSSCWPLASDSSWWLSVTPTPANGFRFCRVFHANRSPPGSSGGGLWFENALEEHNHDFRLFTGRSRLRGAAVLPDLRAAAAGAVLTAAKGPRPGWAAVPASGSHLVQT